MPFDFNLEIYNQLLELISDNLLEAKKIECKEYLKITFGKNTMGPNNFYSAYMMVVTKNHWEP